MKFKMYFRVKNIQTNYFKDASNHFKSFKLSLSY